MQGISNLCPQLVATMVMLLLLYATTMMIKTKLNYRRPIKSPLSSRNKTRKPVPPNVQWSKGEMIMRMTQKMKPIQALLHSIYIRFFLTCSITMLGVLWIANHTELNLTYTHKIDNADREWINTVVDKGTFLAIVLTITLLVIALLVLYFLRQWVINGSRPLTRRPKIKNVIVQELKHKQHCHTI